MQAEFAKPSALGGGAGQGQILSRLAAGCLSYLAAHPGASGTDVRSGLELHHLSQASRLLARLARQGLIENRRGTGRENAWHLTGPGQVALGEQLPVLSARVSLAAPRSVEAPLPNIHVA